ncbi:MAG: DUF885 domain-containing protein [Eubacteriales bacterium]|jgi:uncharacterized protein (DUF885 family)
MKNRRMVSCALCAALVLTLPGLSGCGSDSGAEEQIESQSGGNDVDVNSASASDEADSSSTGSSDDPEDIVAEWYEPVEDTGEDGTKTEGFDDFLNDWVIESYGTSYLLMHQACGGDWESIGIEKPDPVFTTIKWSDFSDEAQADMDDLEELRTYDYDALTEEQQAEYTILEQELENDYVLCMHPEFYFLFGGSADVINDIVTSLSDFTFNYEEEFDDFVSLIESVPDYMDSILEVTEKQASMGYFITESELSNVLDEIDAVIDAGEDSSIISSFNDSIDAFDGLTDEEKQDYKDQVKSAVTDKLIPSFQEAEDKLMELDGSRDGDDAMCSLENGAAYYDVLVRTTCGYETSVPEVFQILQDRLGQAIEELAWLQTQMTDEEYTEEIDMDSAEEIMDYLKNHMDDYPDGPDSGYTISYLNDDEKSDRIVAYYLIAPLNGYDTSEGNIIRVNPDSTSNPNELYITLAHEGYPGHLYQSTYYMDNNDSLFRYVSGPSAYTEGWAEYADYEAMLDAPLSENSAEYYALNEEIDYVLMAIMDIGYNYYGWSENTAEKFMVNCGFSEEYAAAAASGFLESASGLPSLYISYGLGMAQILNMRDEAEEELGSSFDVVEFHSVILDGGCRPLDMVEEDVEEWIDTMTDEDISVA